MEMRSPTRVARLAFRQPARRLLQDNRDVSAHFARLHAALDLPGSEPVQGALADLFATFGADQEALKRSALQMVHGRLAAHVSRWFEQRSAGAALPRSTMLATRWSVLAQPSADISTRARRCSVDVSRALAEQVIATFDQPDDDESAQIRQDFLHHCVTCEDALAFMLARRALLRKGAALTPDWESVSEQLERAKASA